jgi:hybrid polyketide synthase/nonribosomal peptide synthetase ACE1
VHEADRALQVVIQAKAMARDIRTVFTTTELRQSEDSDAAFLRPDSPRQAVQSVVPACTAIFVHFSRGAVSDAVGVAIDKCLPPACLRVGEEALFGHEINLFVDSKPSVRLGQRLQHAWSDAARTNATEMDCIALEDVCQHTAVGEPLALVCWDATASVAAKVQPIDSGVLFRADKTYLFVGMAGELGQSLAEWMVAHGARYVILTSRTRPK